MTTNTKRNINTHDKELSKLTTVSSKIRLLDSKGFTRSEISKKLGKCYQHVRNVLITPITKQK